MTEYFPDKWAVVELKTPEETLYKVLASWYGGYLSADSWKLSSGIMSVTKTEHGYEFNNYSGSVYKCHKHGYGMSMYTAGIYSSWEAQATDELQIRLLDEKEIDKMDLSPIVDEQP